MKVSTYLGAVVVLAVAGLIKMSSPIVPVAFTLPPLPENNLKNSPQLSQAKYLWDDFVPGPESFTVDDAGLLYTGLSDGRIVQLDPSRPNSEPVVITFTGDPHMALPYPCGKYHTEHICGRPLGLRWDGEARVAKRAHASGHNKGKTSRGSLIVADAYLGLLSIDVEEKKIISLARKAKGDKKDFNFTNDLEISSEGVVYFTDSSHFKRRDYIYDLLEGTKTGRLLQYDPKDLTTTVLASGLGFPNGVLLTKDETKLIFAETSQAKISVYHLKGPSKGKVETLIDNLSGLPDNLAWTDSSKKAFYATCATRRTKPFSLTDALQDYPQVRNYIAKVIPAGGGWLMNAVPKVGLVFKITLKHSGGEGSEKLKGEITQTLYDDTGRTQLLSIAYPHGDTVYLGTHSPHFASIAAIPREQ